MRVIVLSWEYPPENIGGLGRHVWGLTWALARQGFEVHVICPGVEGERSKQYRRGLYVHRARPYSLTTPGFIPQVLQQNVSLLECAASLIYTLKQVDLIHAHDWLVTYVAQALKHAYRLPLVATIHATEYGRNHGLHTEEQRFIGSVEWWLVYEAWRVICCSNFMQDELQRVFQLPVDKITMISNGINLDEFRVDPRLQPYLKDFRHQYAHPEEKIVLCVARLVHEKGVQVLLEALPRVLAVYPQTKLVIVGRGPGEGYLKHRAGQLGITHQVYFTGYIDDQTRNQLYQSATVAVFPSLYEPFGIVALEAMAAGVPVVVSDTGGISEIVKHGVDGLKAATGSADSLATQIIEILTNPDLGQRLQAKAYQKVSTRFTWDEVARQTGHLYVQVKEAWAQSDWGKDSPLFVPFLRRTILRGV
ncbi:MAG: glycosyltransferase family 4 protein [Syntrophomonadaceae bacterium]|nr:glycosyltransferase family 4 protein [Syntrophomonadaceae bacterium]